MERIIERFLRYIAIDTQADEKAGRTPSSDGQFELGKLLVKELNEMGAEDVCQDEHAYVYAHLRANSPAGEKTPCIGFLAHLDTSPALGGRCLNPRFVDYKGGDIPLNEQFVMRADEFPGLKKHIGKHLIVTDGTTLMGADDKAGLAAAVETLAWFIEHPEVEHGPISFCACPDEEIGHGASLMDLERFGAAYAFTIDGGAVGEMEFETFNAASAHIRIQGKSVHPGSAKNIMLNAADLACEFHRLLPEAAKPQYTENYEGFFMLDQLHCGVEDGEMVYIIRDHDRKLFEEKKELMQAAVDFFNRKHGQVLSLTLKDSYYNMRDKMADHMDIVEDLKEAMRSCGIKPHVSPVRGGTDGSQLSWRGLPCPNFFAGGENYHGRYEFIPEDALGQARDVAVALVRKAVAKKKS